MCVKTFVKRRLFGDFSILGNEMIQIKYKIELKSFPTENLD